MADRFVAEGVKRRNRASSTLGCDEIGQGEKNDAMTLVAEANRQLAEILVFRQHKSSLGVAGC